MFLLLQSVSSVDYTLKGFNLIISGNGQINQAELRSKGNHADIKQITINEGPESIAESAFYECTSLESIYISKTVLTIGQCFGRCYSLSSITVDSQNPNYYTDSQHALYTKDKKTLLRAPTIQNFAILDSVVTIEGGAFHVYRKYKYGDIVFPKLVTTFNDGVFSESQVKSIKFAPGSTITNFFKFKWSDADEITVPNSVTTIPAEFVYSANVGKIIFEETSKIEKFVANTFYYVNIEEFILPNSIKVIEENAFYSCSMTTITIGPNCQTISEKAFTGCGNLNKYIISPQNTYYVPKNGAIMHIDETQILCVEEGATSITFPSKVTKIGKTMLQSAPELIVINLDSTATYNTEGGVLYSSDFTKLLAVCGGVTAVTANANVLSISEFAATHCSKLESFEFSGSITTEIGRNAFTKTGIKSFTLPASVQTIGEEAFMECYNLTTFVIPPNSEITTIGYYAFYTAYIESIFIPKNLQAINYGFIGGDYNLTKIEFHENSILSSIYHWAFNNVGLEEITFPASLSFIEYQSFQGCHKLKSIKFKEVSSLPSIGSSAFSDCELLTEVYLPSSCTTLDHSVFLNCASLKIVDHSLTTISSGAFSGCSSLEDFNFSSTQTIPDPSIFKGCSNLKKFNVPLGNTNIKGAHDSVFNPEGTILYLFPPGQDTAFIYPETEEFANNAFAWSTKLHHVAFSTGSKLTTIGEYTFFECTALQYFQFPIKLATIQSHCFDGCSSLKMITLPESIKTIGEYAFANCGSLHYVKYCGTNEVSGSNVFSQHTTIGVTQYYLSDYFCSIRVTKELTVDCELIVPELSCDCRPNFLHLGAYLLYLIIN